MTTTLEIRLLNDRIFFTREFSTLEELKKAIDSEMEVPVFWYMPSGKLVHETVLIIPENLQYIITDSDV